MKNSIYIYNNVNLIFITYTFLFFKLLQIIFMLLDSFDHARQVSKQLGWWKWKWKNLDFALLEIHETIMAPK